jgi:apolipoprotein N-acyltransferase
MASYLMEGFNAYCEAVLDEGIKEFGKNMLNKAGKAVAVGALALGALGAGTNANAANHHTQPTTHTKAYTATASHKNLGFDQEYQDRKDEILQALSKKTPNKDPQVLMERAQNYAMTEMTLYKKLCKKHPDKDPKKILAKVHEYTMNQIQSK